MKTNFIIPVHSLVDVITNSSTEIYVVAHSKTLEILKEIIDDVLALGDSDFTADDLFTFSFRERNLRKEMYEADGEEDEYNEQNSRYDTVQFVVIEAKDGRHKSIAENMSKKLEDLFDTYELSSEE